MKMNNNTNRLVRKLEQAVKHVRPTFEIVFVNEGQEPVIPPGAQTVVIVEIVEVPGNNETGMGAGA